MALIIIMFECSPAPTAARGVHERGADGRLARSGALFHGSFHGRFAQSLRVMTVCPRARAVKRLVCDPALSGRPTRESGVIEGLVEVPLETRGPCPPWSARSREPVTATTGGMLAAWVRQSSRRNSKPSISGIRKSQRTRSGASVAITSSASRPSRATSTLGAKHLQHDASRLQRVLGIFDDEDREIVKTVDHQRSQRLPPGRASPPSA